MTSVLAKLRALEAAATPGPWESTRQTPREHGWDVWTPMDDEARDECVCQGSLERNAALIAAARNALPLLLEVAEAARSMSSSHNVTLWLEEALEALNKLELP